MIHSFVVKRKLLLLSSVQSFSGDVGVRTGRAPSTNLAVL